MGLRFLIIEGNTPAAREAHRAVTGSIQSESYGQVLQEIEPSITYDIAFPADEGASLPDRDGLAGYDGVVLTGSYLNIYNCTPEVLRQVDLMRAVYASGTPAFGSCWGLQVASVAAGGDVQANPHGREVGFARRIRLTRDGRSHPMLAGRPEVFDAPAIHLDMVTQAPAGSAILAVNTMSAVQAAEIHYNGGCFWGVQYHPEFSLGELAAILIRSRATLTDEGFCRTREDADAYIADLAALHHEPERRDLAWRHGIDEQVLDPWKRTTEIRNFVEKRVKVEKSARGRA
jgi:GMP synthase (glutamine-hydrolysing)